MYPVRTTLLVTTAVFLTAICVVRAFRSWTRVRRLAKLRGCKPMNTNNAWDWIGFSELVSAFRAVQAGAILDHLDQKFELHGETYNSRFFGQEVIFTCDASNIRQLLISQWSDYYTAKHLRSTMFQHLAPDAIAAADGQHWKAVHDMWRNELMKIYDFVSIDTMENHFQALLSRISPGEVVDMQALFIDLMTDLMGEMMLGESLECLSVNQPAEKRRFAHCLETVQDRMAKDGFLGPASIFLSKKRKIQDTEYLRRYVEAIVRSRLDQEYAERQRDSKVKRPSCMLESLMLRTKDAAELRDALLSLIAGANHSIGALLSSAIWALSRNPKIFGDLRSDVLRGIGNDPPTIQQLKILTCINHVLYEVLRLYPPLPVNARLAKRDTWLNHGGGATGQEPVVVKEGQCVVFSIWGSHRSPRNFGSDAHVFNPERWNHLKMNTQGFLPFLMGPRQCLGQPFAMLESAYILTRLVQVFSSVESKGNEGFKPVLRMALQHADGVRVTFKKG